MTAKVWRVALDLFVLLIFAKLGRREIGPGAMTTTAGVWPAEKNLGVTANNAKQLLQETSHGVIEFYTLLHILFCKDFWFQKRYSLINMTSTS
ncbi:hypothetical protein [Leptospira brenneri]|uniref:hypothetical protein n=1 Tax=Leptospira brenneri TaxID=2023182 RepID=UPI000C2A7950|nr:hypothetical protein [Leptospira brenneri]PJZ46791.1 hypothetical protein CH361_00015 [Leptospira brenneri]